MAPMDDNERPRGQENLSDAVAAMRGKPGARLKRSIPVEGGTIELQVSAFDKNCSRYGAGMVTVDRSP